MAKAARRVCVKNASPTEKKKKQGKVGSPAFSKDREKCDFDR